MKNAADYNIRWANDGDLPAIVKLLQENLGTGTIPRTPEFWSWKHRRNPFGPSPCLLAEADNIIIGMRVFLRWRWKWADRYVRAVRAVDTATHSEWRGKGIFSHLTLKLAEEMRDAGVSFVFNTPNPYSRPGYLKMGWVDVARVPVLIRPLRPLRMGACFLGLTSGDYTGPQALDGLPSISSLFQQGALEPFLADLEPYEKRLCTPRNYSYLRWRYRDIPGFQYKALWEFEGNAGAVVIARPRLRGRLREITLSEVLATPDRKGVRMASALIKRIAKQTDADYIAACAVRGTLERKVLRHARFVPFSFPGPPFTVRVLNPAHVPDPTSWTNWRLSIGDLEIF